MGMHYWASGRMDGSEKFAIVDKGRQTGPQPPVIAAHIDEYVAAMIIRWSESHDDAVAALEVARDNFCEYKDVRVSGGGTVGEFVERALKKAGRGKS